MVAALLALTLAFTSARAQHIVTTAERTQAEALLQEAYNTYQAGDYSQAHLLIDKAQKLLPDQADSWNLRGAVYLKQASYEKAETAFARAVALDPNLWAAQFNLGEVAFHQKDYRRARERFEALLNQTDRYKEANRWELAAYKAFLSSLLLGDDSDAHKRLAKLPAKGATPAYLYAQAALSFSRKDIATAEKTLALARATYPPTANDLFDSSLETIGWQAAAPPSAPVFTSAPPVSGRASYAGGAGERPMQIDPRLEAAVADPLPTSGGPVYDKVPALTGAGDPLRKAADAPKPIRPANGTALPAATASPVPDHTGLLLE
jgi:Tfp pilus assembly protein PilF